MIANSGPMWGRSFRNSDPSTLERIAGAMLSARVALKAEYEKLHKTLLAIVRDDAVCRRLMTVPSVGPVVAITYKSAIDDPNRITKSKAAGALFGLTPRKYQSGENDVTGGITRAGDEMARRSMKPPMFCWLAKRGSRNSNAGRWTSLSGGVQSERRSPWRARSQ
jgi:transposase